MAGELLAGLGAFKAMFDLAKGLKDVSDATARNAIAIELQEKILTAQAEQSALIERVGELETQVAEFEAWDADKQRYELKEIASGQFAYALKPEAAAGEPPHMLCANCYNQNHKAILQMETRNPGRHQVHFCQSCSGEIFSPDSGGRDDPPRPTRQNSGGGSWVKARRGQ